MIRDWVAAAGAAIMLACTDPRWMLAGAVVLAVAGGAVKLRRANRKLDAILDGERRQQ